MKFNELYESIMANEGKLGFLKKIGTKVKTAMTTGSRSHEREKAASKRIANIDKARAAEIGNKKVLAAWKKISAQRALKK